MRASMWTPVFALAVLAACGAPDAQETIRQYQFGAGEGDQYEIVMREVPRPTAGPDEVLVRMRATSLNYRDVRMLNDTVGRNGVDYSGNVLLSDGAGEVVAVGSNVSQWAVGDRVAGTFYANWDGGKLTPASRGSARPHGADGVLSEFVLTPANGLVAIPDYLSFEEAATLPCAAVTAWSALFKLGNLQAGETVLLEGTGGVSTFGLLLSAAAGARPIITSSSNEKLARARELGAAGTVNYRENPEWQNEVRALTDNVGVDHILEIGGASTLPRAVEALSMDGHIAMIGSVTGDALSLDVGMLRSRIGRFSTMTVGSREDFEAMLVFMEEHQIRPVIDSVFPFEQAADAFDLMENGSYMGKIVITL